MALMSCCRETLNLGSLTLDENLKSGPDVSDESLFNESFSLTEWSNLKELARLKGTVTLLCPMLCPMVLGAK